MFIVFYTTCSMRCHCCTVQSDPNNAQRCSLLAVISAPCAVSGPAADWVLHLASCGASGCQFDSPCWTPLQCVTQRNCIAVTRRKARGWWL